MADTVEKISSPEVIRPLAHRVLATLHLRGVASLLGVDGFRFAIRRLLTQPESENDLEYAISQLQNHHPSIGQSAKPEEWAKAIISSMQEYGIIDTLENRAMLLTIPVQESGLRRSPPLIPGVPFLERDMVGKETVGPCQVSVTNTIRDRGLEVDPQNIRVVARELRTVEGGIRRGVELMAAIIKLYEPYKPTIGEPDMVQCCFADYNAGWGSSLIAGMQKKLNKESNTSLEHDGRMGPQTKAALERYLASRNISLPLTFTDDVKDASVITSSTGTILHSLGLFGEPIPARTIRPFTMGTAADTALGKFVSYLEIKHYMRTFESSNS